MTTRRTRERAAWRYDRRYPEPRWIGHRTYASALTPGGRRLLRRLERQDADAASVGCLECGQPVASPGCIPTPSGPGHAINGGVEAGR